MGRVSETIRNILPSARLSEEGRDTEIKYCIPMTEIHKFPLLFQQLEDELGVGSFVLGSTTMEDIFLK